LKPDKMAQPSDPDVVEARQAAYELGASLPIQSCVSGSVQVEISGIASPVIPMSEETCKSTMTKSRAQGWRQQSVTT